LLVKTPTTEGKGLKIIEEIFYSLFHKKYHELNKRNHALESVIQVAILLFMNLYTLFMLLEILFEGQLTLIVRNGSFIIVLGTAVFILNYFLLFKRNNLIMESTIVNEKKRKLLKYLYPLITFILFTIAAIFFQKT